MTTTNHEQLPPLAITGLLDPARDPYEILSGFAESRGAETALRLAAHAIFVMRSNPDDSKRERAMLEYSARKEESERSFELSQARARDGDFGMPGHWW
jgi:hypothetical protein